MSSAVLLDVPQTYIGRVNVVGDCYCFGAVVDRLPPTYQPVPIYLSVAGPATSVEALWAKLAQGKETAIVPDDKDKASISLQPTGQGLYKRHQKKIEALGIDHLILLHDDLAEPCYHAEDDVIPHTYILALSEAQRQGKLGEHIRKLVKVAVFDTWLSYLEQEGHQRGLLQRCTGYGIDAQRVALDSAKWTAVITDGLAKERIALP